VGKEADSKTWIFLNDKLLIELPKFELGNVYYARKDVLHHFLVGYDLQTDFGQNLDTYFKY
jgi:hypothetical protein